MEAWVADGGGRTLIEESDPRWKDFTTVIEAHKKTLATFFSQDRYRPAMLDGGPVAFLLVASVESNCES
jgi:hypothetical protein